jgi:DUF4097 and DUF4098 domain-containing protein YvlB
MYRLNSGAVLLIGLLSVAAPVSAQRLPFERSFDVGAGASLDVTTAKGKIDVVAGQSQTNRVVINGVVSIRIGLDVPADAAALAQKVAADPPIERSGDAIRITLPSNDRERRAVTISYRVTVPPGTHVRTTSESGATTIRDVAGQVDVRTQSAAIELSRLGGAATVVTGSGAVLADGIGGALTVTTQSSAFSGKALAGHVRVRTQSGAVSAMLTGRGDVDVETHSSSIDLSGVSAAMNVQSSSGRIAVQGTPRSAPWTVSTGSGGITLTMARNAAFELEANSGSGSVKLTGATVTGATSKKSIAGTVAGGGSLVRVNSRSGSVHVELDTRTADRY